MTVHKNVLCLILYPKLVESGRVDWLRVALKTCTELLEIILETIVPKSYSKILKDS